MAIAYLDAVRQWQTIIGVTADGQFGPQTKAATINWQKGHGITADGVVGPQTWTAAGLSGMPLLSAGSTSASGTPSTQSSLQSSTSIFSRIADIGWQGMLGVGVLAAIGYEILKKYKRSR